MPSLENSLRLPDAWQQQAIRALQKGQDVVVGAPTGAGKTYIFELLIESGFRKRAVYTVPTRALANDKLLEWRKRGWNVGIVTGDVAENTDAPVVVATLETQKPRVLNHSAPDLLVVDEYQMLGDSSRGLGYEMTIALAPPSTQLLLLSGSVGNPGQVRSWLEGLGREVTLIHHRERPVPLEEVNLDSLPDRGVPASVTGFWPRAIAKALRAGLGPILVFAPLRRAAERLARQLASALPEDEPLHLTPEQKTLAGEPLSRLLRARIAFHHSGLDYRQRAGLIEPLSKAGQLRVVVATMGLSSGINFSLRSVLVSDREYRALDQYKLVRPDELLQMFGRAGRRGLDKKGYILVAPDKPRLSEARPLALKRVDSVDWPALLAIIHQATGRGVPAARAASEVLSRLFSQEPVTIGMETFRADRPDPGLRSPESSRKQTYVEILNSQGEWERRRAVSTSTLGQALVFRRGQWVPALQSAKVVHSLTEAAGTVCRLPDPCSGTFGREIPLGRVAEDPKEGEVVLNRWVQRKLHQTEGVPHRLRQRPRRQWTLESLESEIVPLLPYFTCGGRPLRIALRHGQIVCQVEFSQAPTQVRLDSVGQALLDPPERTLEASLPASMDELFQPAGPINTGRGSSIAALWHRLGLIDAESVPTLRGIVFSYFNHAEGFAIAVALEDPDYDLHQLIFDLANLRAGHRFAHHNQRSNHLGNLSRMASGGLTIPGYLRQGVPVDYGEGAAEILAQVLAQPSSRHHLTGEELLSGDIERAVLEWRSLLQRISLAGDCDWPRWASFKRMAMQVLKGLPPRPPLADFPPLTPEQCQRHKSFLRFD